MQRRITIIGGDKRMVILAELLSKENIVISYGHELYRFKEGKDILEGRRIFDAISKSDIIIGPIPFTKDKESIYSIYSRNRIMINDLLEILKQKIFIAGAIPKELLEKIKKENNKVIDLMQYEKLAVLNTIATAEGTIEIAIKKTEKTIQESNVLVLGYGRVGKVVANKFNLLNANVTCAVRRSEIAAWVETDGYRCIDINNIGANLKNFDIIINTPPALILSKERLRYLKDNCLIIDLASYPGGIDFDAAKELQINYEWALGLPGKVAPVTSAINIKKVLNDIFEEEGM